MVFSDIKVRSNVIISVTNGSDMQARFMSKVMKNTGEYILVIPFRHKGVRINFDGKDVKVHLEMRDNEGVLWSFKNCKVTAVKKDGLIYHRLVSPMKNGIENRRGGRRFYVWDQATFDIEGVTNTVFAILRDIGVIGFSFAVDNSKPVAGNIKPGKSVKCTFKGKGNEIHISGMIVRTESLDKYMIYGCKLDEPPEDYINYVKYLERKNIIVDAEI